MTKRIYPASYFFYIIRLFGKNKINCKRCPEQDPAKSIQAKESTDEQPKVFIQPFFYGRKEDHSYRLCLSKYNFLSPTVAGNAPVSIYSIKPLTERLSLRRKRCRPAIIYKSSNSQKQQASVFTSNLKVRRMPW